MNTYNTDEMTYVLYLTGERERLEFPFMGGLIKEAMKQEDIGNGFYSYIEHKNSDGKLERIPFCI